MDILRYGRGSKTRYSLGVNLREAFFDENIENTLSDFVSETTND